jgi:signal transduction histidine kinase/ligand-binding sensor domain-containing protein
VVNPNPSTIANRLFNSFAITVVLASGSTNGHSQVLKRLPYTTYNVNEGLLQSQVSDIAQDGHGFMWISYSNGLQRFDGRNFELLSSSPEQYTATEKTAKFFRLKSGDIWISSQDGITGYNRFTHRFYTIIDKKRAERYRLPWIIAEEDSVVWCWFRGSGIYAIHKTTTQFTDSIRTLPDLNNEFYPATIHSLPHYFVMQVQDRLVIYNKQTRSMSTHNVQPSQAVFYTSEKYAGDTMLVATMHGIDKIDCATGKTVPVCVYKTMPFAVNRLHPVQLKMLNNGICLVSEASRLFELDVRRGAYTAELVNQQNKSLIDIGYITAITADDHNNIWITTENDGIRKINYRFAGFRYFGTGEKQRNFSKSIYVDKDDNRVLCGSFGNGMTIFDTTGILLKVIDHFPESTPMHTVCAFRKIEPHRYLVFLMGTWNVYVLNTETFSLQRANLATSSLEKFVPDIRLPDYHLSVHALNDSITLLQSGYFAYRLNKGKANNLQIHELGRFSEPSVSSYLDGHRNFWIGSYGKYFVCNLDTERTFRSFDIPGKKLVRCFYNDNRGFVWIGTGKGLYQANYNHQIVKAWTREHGLIDENIYSIRGDKNNNLWFSHNKGISCLRNDGSFMHFSKADGLQENEFNTNTSFVAPDGEMYFGGVNGVSSFFPEAVTAINEQPEVLLTGLVVKDHPYNGDSASWSMNNIQLPYSGNVVSFSFSAIGNRSADQYNYQYQLIGQDGAWVDGGNNPQVRYVLQPGKYTFRYYAGNSFEKNPANFKQLSILITPPFWRTTWFIFLSIVVLISVVVILTRTIARRKLKKQIAELQQTKALNEERLRISREMHDDIGAGLTQITLMSEAARRVPDDDHQLEEIAGTSRKLVGSINEIIWSLHPENQTLEQLLAYLREQLSQLLEYSGINYRISFPDNGSHTLLNNAQRRNLLLVTKEIVHNAVKHSRANQIDISCRQKNSCLEFDITDDGVGFDPAKNRNGNGLHNIKRRVEELGGKMVIKSYSDSGTHFFYSVPLN